MERQYDLAKKEYETEDFASRHRLVYAYFGLAVYSVQCFEEMLSIMLSTYGIIKYREEIGVTDERILEIVNEMKEQELKRVSI